jgi:hypothetical protein
VADFQGLPETNSRTMAVDGDGIPCQTELSAFGFPRPTKFQNQKFQEKNLTQPVAVNGQGVFRTPAKVWKDSNRFWADSEGLRQASGPTHNTQWEAWPLTATHICAKNFNRILEPCSLQLCSQDGSSIRFLRTLSIYMA